MKLRLWRFILGLLVGLTACSRPASTTFAPQEPTLVVATTPAPIASPTLLPVASLTVAVIPTASPVPAATLTAVTTLPLRSFEMVDANTGWGAGDRAVLRTSDGGRSWQVVTPAGLDLDSDMVPQVTAGDARAAWLLVPNRADFSRGTLYRTRDGGGTWQSAPVPFGGAMLQFLDPERGFVMADRGVAAGSHAVDIYASADGGASWTLACAINPQQPADGCLPFGGNKSGITFRDPTHGWLGGFAPIEGETYLYATADGGKTWQPVQLPLPVDFEKAQMEVSPPRFFGEQAGVLVVRATLAQDVNNQAAQIFYTTHDGGRTWQAAPPLRSIGLVALAGAANWVVWDGGSLLSTTHDGGQSWQTLRPDVDLSEKITALQFINPNLGWALSMEGETTRLYRTTDGGRTWQ